MKKNSVIRTPFTPLSFAVNMLLVYVVYTVCRVVYYLENADAFPLESFGWWSMLKGSLLFDTSAILYTNALYALMMLLPMPMLAGSKGYGRFSELWAKTAKWLFVAVNSLCCVINIADSVYFKFTGRRTTCSVFQEFGNEDNLSGILLTETLRHWYLVVFGMMMIFALAKLYVTADETVLYNKVRKPVYYIARIVCMALFVPLCIGGMRGGLSHAVRPITISNANQYVQSPSEAALILNTPFSMLRTVSKKSFVDPGYFSQEELDGIYTPVHRPEGGETNRKNVVILIVESFGKEYVGAFNRQLDGGRYKGFTPFLDSLIEKSLTFEYSFANGRKSIDGMPSILSSIPMFVEPFFLTPSSMNDVSGMAGELGREGYHTAFFHGAENGSMGFEAFAKATGFDEYYGRTEYDQDKRFNGDKDFDGMWAIWDEPFLQFYAMKMSEFKEPFLSAVFTASSHHPFAVPEKYKDVYKDDGINPIHKCVEYTDMALRRFFETASRQPWFKNTLFVLTCDHTNLSDHAEYKTDLGVYAAPIIFYDPSGCLQTGSSKVIAQQIDIMPTVLAYLGYENPFVAFGKNLLDTKPEDSWAVNYNNGIYQYVKGEYLVQFDGQSLCGIYRFREDMLLKRNLLKEKAGNPELRALERELKAVIQSYMHRMQNNELIIK